MKHEAKFTTRFKKWMKASNVKPECGAYEIKVTTGNRIPFDAVKQHQVDALSEVKHGCFVFKIPDAGWQNPFDAVVMAKQPAYVVLAFVAHRQKTVFYIVDVDFFLEIKNKRKDKSITKEQLDTYCGSFPSLLQRHII